VRRRRGAEEEAAEVSMGPAIELREEQICQY
jgi:hypothetical protein